MKKDSPVNLRNHKNTSLSARVKTAAERHENKTNNYKKRKHSTTLYSEWKQKKKHRSPDKSTKQKTKMLKSKKQRRKCQLKRENVNGHSKSTHIRKHSVPIRDRKRIELSNNSIRLDSIQSNGIESNSKFEKVDRIESSRIQTESNRIESNTTWLIRVINDLSYIVKMQWGYFVWLTHALHQCF